MQSKKLKTLSAIAVTWIAIECIYMGILAFFPHYQVTCADSALRGISTLLCVLIWHVMKSELDRGLQVVYGGMFILFLFGGPLYFLASLKIHQIMGSMEFLDFYVAKGCDISYHTSLMFCATGFFWEMTGVGSITFRIVMSVTVTVLIAFFVWFPFLNHARFEYTVPAITDFRIIDRANSNLRESGISRASAEEIAIMISLSHWDGSNRVGELNWAEKVARVRELLLFVEDLDYVNLVYARRYLAEALIGMAAVFVMIAGIFRSQWLARPSHAYNEKITIVFVQFCFFEGLDDYLLAFPSHFANFVANADISRLVSTFNLGVLTVMIFARLRFVMSSEGKYYENKIATTPLEVTRWRDGIDNLIIKLFFKSGQFRRRFLHEENNKNIK